jgi:hypothetical protein
MTNPPRPQPSRYTNGRGDVETRTFQTEAAARAWKEQIAPMDCNAVRDGAAPETVGDVWFELQHGP